MTTSSQSNNPNPTRVDPITEPSTEPMRRLQPDKICAPQRSRVGERVRRELQR